MAMMKTKHPIRNSGEMNPQKGTGRHWSDEDRRWNLPEDSPHDLPFDSCERGFGFDNEAFAGEESAENSPKVIAQIPNCGRISPRKMVRRGRDEKSGKKRGGLKWIKSLMFLTSGLLIGIAVSKSPFFLQLLEGPLDNIPTAFLGERDSAPEKEEIDLDSETLPVVSHFAMAPIMGGIESQEIAGGSEWSEESLESIPFWQPESETALFDDQEPSFGVTPEIPSETPTSQTNGNEKRNHSGTSGVLDDEKKIRNVQPIDIPSNPIPEISHGPDKKTFDGNLAKSHEGISEEAQWPKASFHETDQFGDSDRFGDADRFEETAPSSYDAYGFMNSAGEFQGGVGNRDSQTVSGGKTDRQLFQIPTVKEEKKSIEITAASERPMKNEIEYFNPEEGADRRFDRGSGEETTRVAASDDFYEDAYGLGSFSDYSPPKKKGDENLSERPESAAAEGERR